MRYDKKTITKYLLIIGLVISLILTASFFDKSMQALYINEIMSSNTSTIADEDGDYSDYIEIYNGEKYAINLKDYGLSDSDKDLYKWTFPDIDIGPGKFLLVFASGKDRKEGPYLHTNFSIKAEGEDIFLSEPHGRLVDRVRAVRISADMSYGRKDDGSRQWAFFAIPTPGRSNTTGQLGKDEYRITFSIPGGLYEQPQRLKLSTSHRGVQIYYTLDGSEPTDQSLLYSSPIDIISQRDDNGDIKGTIIRAAVYRDGNRLSNIITHSYFVDKDIFSRYTLPIISISTDSDNFFDYEIGIYVPGRIYDENLDWKSYPETHPANYNQRGREWERPIHIEYFNPDGSLGFAQNAGVRIHGDWSRAQPLKSLRLYARSEYGASRFNYRLFPDKEITEFKTFLLRNSGHDYAITMFRDAMVQSLVRDFNVDTQYYTPSIVYINGEYWGIHNIRDRYDSDYLESHYGVDSNKVVILGDNAVIQEGEEGDQNHYFNMRYYISQNDMSQDVHYQYIQTQMDVDNFIDYYVAQIYCNNLDWPPKNIYYWRLKTDGYIEDAPYGHDGRWRWMIFDVDKSFEDYKNDTLSYATSEDTAWPTPEYSTIIIRNLLQNEEFKNKFINRFADSLNTVFEGNNVIKRIVEIGVAIEKEMEKHIDRWNAPSSMEQWYSNIDEMIEFADNRPAYLRQHIADFFSLEGTVRVEINTSHGGRVKLNRVEIGAMDSPWSGIYFKGVPIDIIPLPNPGYRFVGWEGIGPQAPAEVLGLLPDDDISITAIFKRVN